MFNFEGNTFLKREEETNLEKKIEENSSSAAALDIQVGLAMREYGDDFDEERMLEWISNNAERFTGVISEDIIDLYFENKEKALDSMENILSELEDSK